MKRSIKFHVFEAVDSTQNVAKKLAKQPGVLHVIIAHEQTHGKGTFGKNWESPKDKGLYLTFAFESGSLQDLKTLSHLAACSLCQTISSLNPQIKWPNDILIDKKKIAGILTEVQDHHVFSGIGLNIHHDKSIESKIDQPYTSFDDHKTPDMMELANQLASNYLSLLEKWEVSGFYGIKPVFKQYFAYMNKLVIIETPEGLLKGIIVDVSDDGYPILEMGTKTLTVQHIKRIDISN